MDLDMLLRLLGERLDQHDNSRKEIQSQLDGICSDELSLADSLAEEIVREIRDEFDKTEERTLGILNKLSSTTNESGELDALMEQARGELASEQRYEIHHNNNAKSFSSSYSLIIKIEEGATDDNDQEGDDDNDNDKVRIIINNLERQLDRTHESMVAAQDKVMEICAERRRDVEELKKRINGELERLFTLEDARLQEAVNLVRKNIGNENPEEAERAASEARSALVLSQRYMLSRPGNGCSLDTYGITATKGVSPLVYNERKPTNLAASFTNSGEISLSFAFFSQEERVILEPLNMAVDIVIRIWEEGREHLRKEVEAKHKVEDTSPVCFTAAIVPGTRYCLQMRLEDRVLASGWSDAITFTTPDFRECAWKKCPPNITIKRKYSVDEKNPRITTMIINDNSQPINIVGTVPLPPNQVVSWGTKILKSKGNNGHLIYTGAAAFDINLDAGIYNGRGWYFHCKDSTLHSGPPHNYYEKKYGPFWLFRRTTRTGDTIRATMDTAVGALSFSVNGRNYGVAYEGIPLDKPLVPCVLPYFEGDSVELIVPDAPEVKRNDADISVPVPSNVTVKGATWDTITLTWDEVADASFYQIEVDGSKSCDITPTNLLTKKELLPETGYGFRVRTVKRNSVSKWSGVVEGRTLTKSFEASVWKELSRDAFISSKVDEENPRVITKISNIWYGSAIGNIPIPLNAVTSWNIKILKSKNDDGDRIFIGVAPSYISQNYDNDNYIKCGWYFHCYNSSLYSGPPHNYRGKAYGPGKKRNGQYAHTKDGAGVVMDTAKGELSFVLNGVNLGIAYDGIPLDKPLVPCVILHFEGDSVELDISEVKENEVDSSIPVPSNITTKSITWDSITLEWDEVPDASFYQIEVDGSKSWSASTTNAFTKRGLLPETEHSFRVRTVRGSSASEWSDVAKGMTLKESFGTSGWKECPDNVDIWRKYVASGENFRTATNISGGADCTIIGNTPIPLNTVTLWNIKVLNSANNNGYGIYIGVAPNDINQDVDNYDKCGWYFECYDSKLRSGPPHNYRGKEYGPREVKYGLYVRPGDSVGVVMNTTKGDLSFVLNGEDHDVAYERIPLDKPLVPCVILRCGSDSVELILPV